MLSCAEHGKSFITSGARSKFLFEIVNIMTIEVFWTKYMYIIGSMNDVSIKLYP